MNITAAALVDEARKLIGIPFHHQGRNEHGLDCMGLVLLAAQRAGGDIPTAAALPDTRDYGRGVNPRILELLEDHCAARIARPMLGCLMVFRYPHEPLPRHLGVFAGGELDGSFIHADGFHFKRVREDRYAGIWLKRVHSFWKLHGVTYGDAA